MTHNQIAFANLKEQIRHNAATESAEAAKLNENSRHNRADEQIRTTSNYNTRLFNDSTSAVNWFTAKQKALDIQSQNEYRKAQAQRLKDQSSNEAAKLRNDEYSNWIRHYDAANRASTAAKEIELKGARLEIDKQTAYKNNLLTTAKYWKTARQIVLPF